MIKLGGPHLVLADLGGNNGLPLGHLIDLLNHELGFYFLPLLP